MRGEAGSEPLRRAQRGLLAVGVLLGLIAIVAVASAGRAPIGRNVVPSGDAHRFIAEYLTTIALLMLPAGAVLLVWSMFMRRGEQVRRGKPQRSYLTSLVLLAAVVGLIALRVTLPNRLIHLGPASTTPTRTHTVQTKGGHEKRAEPYSPRFRWLPAFLLGSLVLALGGSMGMLVLKRRRGTLVSVPVAVALSKVLDESIDDLRSEPDPRRAVIRTYARMEGTLAARGVPREPFEAPLEYLARVLDVVQASAHSARRLTQLFARARFSPHRIDMGMKDDAIEALDGLRAELEASR